MELGLGRLIVLTLDIWAILNVVGSTKETLGKVLWILLIVVLPVVGFLIWLVASPRKTN